MYSIAQVKRGNHSPGLTSFLSFCNCCCVRRRTAQNGPNVSGVPSSQSHLPSSLHLSVWKSATAALASVGTLNSGANLNALCRNMGPAGLFAADSADRNTETWSVTALECSDDSNTFDCFRKHWSVTALECSAYRNTEALERHCIRVLC